MTEKKKSFLDKAVDALTNRDEKAALEKAQQEAEAAKKEAAELKVKAAAAKVAADKAAAEKAAADRAAAAKAATEKAAALRAAAEKSAAERAAAAAAAVAARKKKGFTTGSLKLRSGPGMEYEPPMAYLKPDTELEILEELENWLKVKVEGKEGYVGKKYVRMEETPSATASTPKDNMGGGIS